MSDSTHRIDQIVLLRGLTRESRHWGTFLDDLKAEFSKTGRTLRLETIDLPGCGRHSEVFAKPSIELTTDFVRERLAAIFSKEVEEGLPPATHRGLVAVSLGGMVAADWLDRFPGDFHYGVLINSSWRGVSPVHERLRFESWWRVPVIVKEQDVRKREAMILDWISNRPERREELLPSWVQIQESRPVSPVTALMQVLAAARYKPPQTLQVPVTIFASRKDRMVNDRCSAAIAARLNAEIHYHAEAGHDLTLDDGPWAAARIAAWGDKVWGRNSVARGAR